VKPQHQYHNTDTGISSKCLNVVKISECFNFYSQVEMSQSGDDSHSNADLSSRKLKLYKARLKGSGKYCFYVSFCYGYTHKKLGVCQPGVTARNPRSRKKIVASRVSHHTPYTVKLLSTRLYM
jgi:hypothetical protein